MEEAKLRPEKRFEANALQYFKIKILRNCPEKTLISDFFQFCQNALKTKILLEVHFRNFRDILEKKLSRIVQLTILRKRKHVASELFFFYVELWAENTNPQHRHTLFTIFAISKIKFLRKFYIRQKNLHESFETYGQDRFWPFSVCCFKSYSTVVAFGIFTALSTAPKNKVNDARLIYIRTVCKIGILSENKLR